MANSEDLDEVQHKLSALFAKTNRSSENTMFVLE